MRPSLIKSKELEEVVESHTTDKTGILALLQTLGWLKKGSMYACIRLYGVCGLYNNHHHFVKIIFYRRLAEVYLTM